MTSFAEGEILMKMTKRKFWCRHCRTLSEVILPAAHLYCPVCEKSFIPPYTLADFKAVWVSEEPKNWLRIHRARNYGEERSSYAKKNTK